VNPCVLPLHFLNISPRLLRIGLERLRGDPPTEALPAVRRFFGFFLLRPPSSSVRKVLPSTLSLKLQHPRPRRDPSEPGGPINPQTAKEPLPSDFVQGPPFFARLRLLLHPTPNVYGSRSSGNLQTTAPNYLFPHPHLPPSLPDLRRYVDRPCKSSNPSLLVFLPLTPLTAAMPLEGLPPY